MAVNSNIEWTEATWNPLAGCKEISPGCQNCYAAVMAHRLAAMGQEKYKGTTRKLANGKVVWTGKINLFLSPQGPLTDPVRRFKPTMYFVNSMSDLFHEEVPFSFIDRVFAVMGLCQEHTFQVLTKRPERMAEYLRGDAKDRTRRAVSDLMDEGLDTRSRAMCNVITGVNWPLPNVWLGTSVEDQKRADERIPHLLMCPAAVRFLSCEPLLGPVDIMRPMPSEDLVAMERGHPCEIDWVIIGGESGPDSRPFDIVWARSLIEQCKAAGVPVFMKQLGSNPDNSAQPDGGLIQAYIRDRKGGNPEEWPEDLRIRQMPSVTTKTLTD